MTDLQKLLSQITPGPWAAMMCDIENTHDGYDQILADASVMGVAELAMVNHLFLAHEANARLIAMAPDLAAALIRAEEALDRLARLGNEPNYGNSDGNVIALAKIRADALREAAEVVLSVTGWAGEPYQSNMDYGPTTAAKCHNAIIALIPKENAK